MVRCHDFAEVITGDRTPGEITPEQKRLEEDDAYDQFCKLEPDRGRVIWELCIEYREDKTPEAELAKDVDKFQRLEQADKYRKEFPELDFRRFQLDADLIRDPELKKEANDIVKAWRKSDLQDMKFIFVIGEWFLL
jgi:5'-deoxynucleotidase YfbR-like HD superfamily hydrolase